MMIKEKLKSMKVMQGPITLYRYFHNKNFNQWIKDFDECNSIFKFEELGISNKDKIIYIIPVLDSTWGLFASWKRVCMGLLVAERYGFTPVVDWGKSQYREEHLINGTDNPFEYYFEPVSDVSLDEASKSYNVTYYSSHTNGMKDTSYDLEGKLIHIFPSVQKKYIRLNPMIKDDIIQQIKEIGLFEKKTLGVHARGGEWRINVKGHPIAVPIESHIQMAKEAMETYKYEQIFIASDEQESVDAFCEAFPGKVVYFADICLGREGVWLAATSSDRVDHHYLLGLEALKDAEALACCSGLIGGISNVTLYAQVRKISKDEKYDYCSIENIGMNSKGTTGRKLTKYKL